MSNTHKQQLADPSSSPEEERGTGHHPDAHSKKFLSTAVITTIHLSARMSCTMHNMSYTMHNILLEARPMLHQITRS
jgi:hypothetical protein